MPSHQQTIELTASFEKLELGGFLRRHDPA
jgi:hypothetical protein